MIGGRYRLEHRIAEGGSAVVWRGFDMRLQRQVAVKIPRAGRLFPSDRGESFLAEARRAARLCHSNIVDVYDVRRDQGLFFIVSELIDGNDLGRHLLSESFTTRETLRLVAEVAEALAHAHQQGIVHRDVASEHTGISNARPMSRTSVSLSRPRNCVSSAMTGCNGRTCRRSSCSATASVSTAVPTFTRWAER